MVPEPCDDRLNPQHNTLLAIPHPGCATARQQCSRYHPGFSNRNGGFSVCNACNTDGLHVLELHGPPNELNRRRLRTVGPPRIQPFTIPPNWQTPLEFVSGHVTPTDPPSYRHNQFLTRMCRKCARIEQTLAQARYDAWVQAPGCDLSYLPGTNEMIEKSQWYNYPWSSCTCYSKLNLARPARLPDRTGPTGQDGLPIPQDGHRSWDVRRLRLCHTHREAKWKELEGARNQNDIWLQNIHLVTPDGTALRQATAAEMQDRVIGAGSWRACRCGAEIDHYGASGIEGYPPEIYQCLACEGTINTVDQNNPTGHMYAPAPWLRSHRPATLKLGRFRNLNREEIVDPR